MSKSVPETWDVRAPADDAHLRRKTWVVVVVVVVVVY